MKELKFARPVTTIEYLNDDHSLAKFEIKHLSRGFGMTIGNGLRRVLLSSLPGTAIVAVSIAGAAHEFQTITGVVEDVMTICQNLKEVIFRTDSLKLDYQERIELSVTGPAEVKASSFKLFDGLEIVNPDAHIATLSEGALLYMTAIVRRGIGYVSYEDNKVFTGGEEGLIAIDSKFAPVPRVTFRVEKDRVGDDELYIEVETNKSIDAKDALAFASHLISDYYQAILEISDKAYVGPVIDTDNTSTEVKQNDSEAFLIDIEELNLSNRLYNALKRSDIQKVNQIIEKSEYDILKLDSIGKKCLTELKQAMKKAGFDWPVKKSGPANMDFDDELEEALINEVVGLDENGNSEEE